MTRDRSARTRIRTYLSTHGPIEDPTGYATGALKDAIGYQGKSVAFIQLIAAMDRDGEITRQVRGKRTYRITLTNAGPVPAAAPEAAVPDRSQPAPVPAEASVEIDYDRLARSLVHEFWKVASAQNLAPAPAAESTSAVDSETVDRLRKDRDEYALRLEIARLKLEMLLGDKADDDALAATAGLARRARDSSPR